MKTELPQESANPLLLGIRQHVRCANTSLPMSAFPTTRPTIPLEPLSIAAILAESGAANAPEFVRTFQHSPTGSVIYGAGVVSLVGKLTAALPARRVLVVTDPGIAAAGHLSHVLQFLHDAGLEVHTFTEVRENPTTTVVAHCVEAAASCRAQALIGLGGGSSMDTAKGCNFILTNGGEMKDYWGVNKASQPMLPFIAIPTTAGTGSECQSFALISDAETHVKMACGDKKAAARVAILDPALTVTQPATVTRHTGIDALTHALESAVCTKATDLSRAYSRASFALLASGFPAVLKHPDHLAARSKMLLGAALAGVAIENAMLGAAHSCANPLTAQFDVVHGEAVGLMMPHVMRLNAGSSSVAAEYDLLAACIGLSGAALPDWFAGVLQAAHLPTQLRHYRITEADLPGLAAAALPQWTAQFNPVPLDTNTFFSLYAAAR